MKTRVNWSSIALVLMFGIIAIILASYEVSQKNRIRAAFNGTGASLNFLHPDWTRDYPILTSVFGPYQKRFWEIEEILSTGHPITDSHLKTLNGYEHISLLVIESSQISNKGLVALANLPGLLNINLSSNSISDSGIKSISKITHLKSLFLDGCNVTDLSAPYFTNLIHLKFLSLEGCPMTKKGINQIQKALPKCIIFHTEETTPESFATRDNQMDYRMLQRYGLLNYVKMNYINDIKGIDSNH